MLCEIKTANTSGKVLILNFELSELFMWSFSTFLLHLTCQAWMSYRISSVNHQPKQFQINCFSRNLTNNTSCFLMKASNFSSQQNYFNTLNKNIVRLLRSVFLNINSIFFKCTIKLVNKARHLISPHFSLELIPFEILIRPCQFRWKIKAFLYNSPERNKSCNACTAWHRIAQDSGSESPEGRAVKRSPRLGTPWMRLPETFWDRGILETKQYIYYIGIWIGMLSNTMHYVIYSEKISILIFVRIRFYLLFLFGSAFNLRKHQNNECGYLFLQIEQINICLN